MAEVDTGLRALGTAVRTRRAAKRWGQEERASREGFAGSVLSNVENEIARPHRKTLPKIDRAMDWPVGMSAKLLAGEVVPMAAAGYEPTFETPPVPVEPKPVERPEIRIDLEPSPDPQAFTEADWQAAQDVADRVSERRPLPQAPVERRVYGSRPKREATITIRVPLKTPEPMLAAVRAVAASVAQAAADELTKGI
jgi:transcriptional regulator with XRE-family HTH domain